MKIGGHCVLFGKQIAEDTDGVISRLAFAGAEGCELGQRFFGVDDRDKLTAVLEKHDISLAGMHCNGMTLPDLLNDPDKSRASLTAVARFVAPLPNRNIIASGGPGDMNAFPQITLREGSPIAELHDAANVRKIAENLNAIARDLKAEYGVQIHYHNHSWEFADNGLIWFALAEYAPDVQFALDTGWAAVSGFDPVELLERYPDRFTYVHLRDYLKSPVPGDRIFKEVHTGFVDLGTGDMNYPRLMHALDKVLGQDDWAIVEYELGNFDTDSYQKAIGYLKQLRSAGF